ncbi:MAG TPA: succinate dehydrogenase, cytochrome b556 subunit [Aggregatilinea sp.]|jgi:succinate dehydrogenase cytochrome b556 subunit|uniref:succinate dehydrogenase, cytochrome b556 subunit n=1 Tax=Aggregatilinea sp. TaxID=2806333 RepID=UPI002CF7C0C2|nr:succinate dehydrogenase, cytochrome b556 subunit [Aggregatilinea sp.]HML21787.1 succinate dehydrogenase, cytochrome b556 subunit [Aggregatilinea sp.]
MATLVTTVTETLRYRGKLGQWSWVGHRLAGLGTLLFLTMHVIDTSWAAFFPDQYEDAIRQYQSPLFTIGEFLLIAAVVYHAFNGLRIILFDYKPEWWEHQSRAAWIVFGASAIVLAPTFLLMFGHVLDFYDGEHDIASLEEILKVQSQFVLGFVVIIVVALVLSALYGAIKRSSGQFNMPGQAEGFMWSFMRFSGILILPLAFGHLAMMHVIQGVFDITGSGLTVVGTDIVNQSGTAVEFVGARWDMLVAGVAIWRIYDAMLLALAAIHGFNGLRYVVDDYAHSPMVNRALNWAILFGMIALIVVGAAALISGADDAAFKIASDSVAAVQGAH